MCETFPFAFLSRECSPPDFLPSLLLPRARNPLLPYADGILSSPDEKLLCVYATMEIRGAFFFYTQEQPNLKRERERERSSVTRSEGFLYDDEHSRRMKVRFDDHAKSTARCEGCV